MQIVIEYHLLSLFRDNLPLEESQERRVQNIPGVCDADPLKPAEDEKFPFGKCKSHVSFKYYHTSR